MPDLLLPDVSEFQTVDFGVFSGPIIVRAHNSNRADNHWPQHAAGASKQPWWAVYQYLTAGADPAAAAHALLATIGSYRPNATILDLEEGSGDQQARQHAWLSVMAGDPAVDWTYSGDYFARAHNLDNVEWVAAYQSREPTTAHNLWQFSDAHTFPGIGACDASIFHGSLDDLLRLTGNAPAPTPQPAPEVDDMVRIMRPDGQATVYAVSSAPSKFAFGDQYLLADFANRFGGQILPPSVGGPTVKLEVVNGVAVEVCNPLFLSTIPLAK
jgi:hypothetical protein